ncbi:PucR family transcriptional regulator [Microbispora triticiradicis]|uniref:PucR family transcriptional regulator n=3 Tax=Microbispora TaxID=2005 RepID=A0ABY3LY84_9ACTN|nr:MULTISPECIES: PucR family transcriptional regulator [Microbispora]RGA01542.1 PucR family transcriptional regulator [Microbispora triticiradicis]TLP55237.1 PucR family transcriptional regulator [Microbispora fusca]TYB59611.1 PucR family transcriptional regulator [Microbispora tritici]
MQDIVDEISRLLGASVTLEDRSFNLLAYGAQSGDIDSVRQESILRRRASDEVRAHFEAYGIATATGPVRIPGLPGVLGRVCVPLRHDGVTYGYLWALESGELTDERLAAVGPLVGRVAALLAAQARGRYAPLRQFFSADPAARAAAGVVAEGPVTAVAVRTPAQDAGLPPTLPRTLPRGVLADPDVIEPGTGGPGTGELGVGAFGTGGPEIGGPETGGVGTGEPGAAVFGSAVRGPGVPGAGVPGMGGAVLAILAPAAQAARVAGLLHGLYGLAAGIGGPRDDPREAWESWREALLALRVAEHAERHAPVADWATLGVYRLLVRLSPRDLAGLAAESAALTPRIAASVEAYLDHAGHAGETAAALGVHRQTLYYRLDKASHLTGLDLADGEDRLLLHLSLKAAALLGGG